MAAEIVVLYEIIDASIDEELPLDEGDVEFHLISAAAAFVKRDLKRIARFCEVVVPSYAIDEFRSHFRMTNTTSKFLLKSCQLACTGMENRILSRSHVDASHLTYIKIGVWPGTGFDGKW